ncbi:bi-domain-containing oxidoreductase [Sphingorhabdus lacus]|jgi:predicted dehydrogenase/threonine dehydrogenase-like Zn-dependent dehydrogenase|uniref:Dehydrogenase n=1 Tax=Sphingorhabdus lacus TaxID=392610 RepID=A0A6I6L665_9SPHN|nr:bi-domain-containing oxidoreductase [Sphingorhabdus lacus]QGY81309.1 dehydrogenase [Sphingorhabdus lacus]
MKQIFQSLKTGAISIENVPIPMQQKGQLLIATRKTLVSAGTERMMLDFGKGNWIQKARQQPDKVKMVLDKIRTDGLSATMDSVSSKLEQPLALGYCNIGVVIGDSGTEMGYRAGDRIVSNGKHAEVVSVPKNLCAKVPDNVTDECAAFTVLGAIGLQGIRLAQPGLGECVVVIGLGLIGLITVQLLVAQGCRVLGIDFDEAKLALARQFGAETASAQDDVVTTAYSFSRGRGVDAVLIAASTRSNDPIHDAAQMCRKRGRIILIGVTGLNLSRADFFEKELSFQVSCSYGPGRYDPAYEEHGNDYPVGYVRWTEQRNFEAVLDMMATGKLNVEPLISHRFALEDAASAYDLLTSGTPSMGIILGYTSRPEEDEPLVKAQPTGLSAVLPSGRASIIMLGAGNYAGRTLAPAFAKAGAFLDTVVSANGSNAAFIGRKYGFANVGSDDLAALRSGNANIAVIATRHNLHAAQVVAALQAGKHVFCEKPLCLTVPELDLIEKQCAESPNQLLMIGFNRRFAPHIIKMKELLDSVDAPKSFIMTVNAGEIDPTHWTQDRNIGGGRIIGEACHFVDLLRFLAGATIEEVQANTLGPHPALQVRDDKCTVTMRFANGSVGTIHYLANGNKAFPKERLEVFSGGKIIALDNFLKMTGMGWSTFKSMRLLRQSKGADACVRAFVNAVEEGKCCPIPLNEVLEISRITLQIAAQLYR